MLDANNNFKDYYQLANFKISLKYKCTSDRAQLLLTHRTNVEFSRYQSVNSIIRQIVQVTDLLYELAVIFGYIH